MKQKVMFFVKLVRGTEWWEYKLALFAALGYATAVVGGVPIADAIWHILFYMLATAISFTYVSLINDFTDLEEDRAVGKKTGMLSLSPRMRWVALGTCIALGVYVGYLMWPDSRSVFFFASTWVVFTLYSVPPFRWKSKGILGVLCDATGVHLFPTLLMVSGVSHALGITLQPFWFLTLAIWSLAFGVRGILWHQVLDRKNDIQTGISTFATKIPIHYLRPIAIVLFVVEMTCFFGMLSMINYPTMWVALLCYCILVAIRYTRYNNVPIIMVTPENRSTQVLMLDYYHAFFPVSLLLIASLSQPWVWLILLIHIGLFPASLMLILRDYWMAIDALYRQIRYSTK